MKRSGLGSVRNAFSLVEVTLALAIFSFAVMALVGLLPVAINNHREAKLNTILSQISQRMTAEVLLSDGSQLSALNEVTRYFDYDGVELGEAQASKAYYRAKIVLTPTFQLPGSATSTSLQRIELYAVQDPKGSLIGSSSLKPTTSMLIPKAESATTPTP